MGNPGNKNVDNGHGFADVFGSTEWREVLRFSEAAPLVEIEDASKRYQGAGGSIDALRRARLTVSQGEFCAVVGPSGSGKSTLLNLIAGLVTPSEGRVSFKGLDLYAGQESVRRLIREEFIGLIPQEINLIRYLTAMENVELPMEMLGIGRVERRHRAKELLTEVGLRKRENHLPMELSTGEQQRTALARALALNPALVLADEPTANLDSATGEKVIALMERERTTRGATFLLATHDPTVTGLCDRVLYMRDGMVNDLSIPIASELEIVPPAFFTKALFDHLLPRVLDHLLGRVLTQEEEIRLLDTSFKIRTGGMKPERFVVDRGTKLVYLRR